MNTYKLYFLGLFLGAACVVLPSVAFVPALRDYGVVCEKNSRLAKDTELSELYIRALEDLSQFQGTAEIVRELHALADWTGLKKGKAPKHFHKRLSALKKTVRQTEWLTDEQKKLAALLIDRLGKKKQRHTTAAAVCGSLTAVAVGVCLGGMVVAKMRKNKRTGYGNGLVLDDRKPAETSGFGGDGGMGAQLGQRGTQEYQPNPFAHSLDGLNNGSSASPHAVPTAPPLGSRANHYPNVPTSAVHPSAFPDAPTTPLDPTAGYGPVQQHQAGVPAGLQTRTAQVDSNHPSGCSLPLSPDLYHEVVV